MFRLLARLVTRHGAAVFGAWVGLLALMLLFVPSLRSLSRDDDVRYFPKNYPTVIGQDLLEKGFPNDVSSSSYVVIGERRLGTLTDEDLEYLDGISAIFARLRESRPELQIKTVTDRRTPIIGPRLVGTSPDGSGQATLINVALKSTYTSRRSRLTVDEFEKVLAKLPPPPVGLNLATTGSAAVGHDQNTAQNESIAKTTDATVALVIIILLLVYRSPLLAFIPLVTIAISVLISMRSIAALSLLPGVRLQVINITDVFVTVILFGAGTDYCLFLIARYREELARGRPRDEALGEAIQQVGGALVASAGTVIVGLGMLYFSSFAKIQYTGPAIALSLAIALAAGLSLGPVLLHWLRSAVFWPFRPPHHEEGRDPEQEGLEQTPAVGFWSRVAEVVVGHPGAILAASLGALVPFAIVGLRTEPNFSQTGDLRPEAPSMRGTRVIQRYFPAGELGPTSVYIEHPELSFRSEEGIAAVEALSRELAQIDNIAEVRSISRPLGKPLEAVAPASAPEGESFLQRMNRLRREAQANVGRTALRTGAMPRYVSTAAAGAARDHITRIEVVFRTDPFSPESLAAGHRVWQVVNDATRTGRPLAGATAVGLSGSTAMVNDLRDVVTRDQRRMYVLVTLGVYAILVFLLRRPGISLYLIVTVILGYLASLGLTELVFHALHQGPEPWVGLDWKVGFFLFVILVAVGEDYNIFLMARVLEEERKHGPIEGTRLAVAHTGGIISSCGLIMAGTFGSMLTGTLTSLQELGFALGVGVLLDTFIVRPVLVPAFVVLWHRLRPSARLDSGAFARGETSSDRHHAAPAEAVEEASA